MHWKSCQIKLRERLFEAKFCCGQVRDLGKVYLEGLAEVHARGAAWFFRRHKLLKFETGEYLNGIPLYRYENEPDELWRVEACSLQDSLEIAFRHFDYPSLAYCLHGEASRKAIGEFLLREKLADQVRLSQIADSGLSFDPAPNAPRITFAQAKRLIELCVSEFKEGSSRRELAMLAKAAPETGAFAIGSI